MIWFPTMRGRISPGLQPWEHKSYIQSAIVIIFSLSMRHFNRGIGHCLFATQYLCKLRPAANSFRPKTNLPLACRTCTRLSLGLQLARLDPTRVSFSTLAASLLRSEYVRPVQSCINVNFHIDASVVVIHVRIACTWVSRSVWDWKAVTRRHCWND